MIKLFGVEIIMGQDNIRCDGLYSTEKKAEKRIKELLKTNNYLDAFYIVYFKVDNNYNVLNNCPYLPAKYIEYEDKRRIEKTNIHRYSGYVIEDKMKWFDIKINKNLIDNDVVE